MHEERRSYSRSTTVYIYYVVIRHLTKFKEQITVYFTVFDSHKISWVVDPYRCYFEDVPDEIQGLAEALLELQSNNEASVEFANKICNLTHFWMSNAAKAFNIAHEEGIKTLPFAITYLFQQGSSLPH